MIPMESQGRSYLSQQIQLVHVICTRKAQVICPRWELIVSLQFELGSSGGGIQQRKELPLSTSNSLIYNPTVRRPPSKTPHQGTHNLRLHTDNIRDRWNSSFLHFETLGKHFAIYLESVNCSETQVKHNLEKLTTISSWTFGTVRRLQKNLHLYTRGYFFWQRRPFRVCERCIRRNKTCKHKEKFMSYENIPVIMKERSRCRSLVRSSAWWMCRSGRVRPLNSVGSRPLNDLPTQLEAVHVKQTENFGVPVD
jgi:hypothetical protein